MEYNTNCPSGTKKVVGIDVAKDELVGSLVNGLQCLRWSNSSGGIKKLIKRLLRSKVELVVLECTGRHERALVAALRYAEIPVHLAHAKSVRNFAKVLRQNAKSDPIDAEVLRLYGIKMTPEPTPDTPSEVKELQDLIARREDLNHFLVQEKNRLKTPDLHAWNKRLIQKTIRFIERQLKETEQLSRVLVEKHQCLSLRVKRIREEHGFGFINAITMVASVPELGTLNRNQIGALTGTAPFIRKSGKYTGEAKIQGGRTASRRALYTAAITVIRKKEHPLHHFYKRLVNKQKPKKEALTAVMRKLAIRINSILKDLALDPMTC